MNIIQYMVKLTPVLCDLCYRNVICVSADADRTSQSANKAEFTTYTAASHQGASTMLKYSPRGQTLGAWQHYRVIKSPQ